jgi:hypothetical protein
VYAAVADGVVVGEVFTLAVDEDEAMLIVITKDSKEQGTMDNDTLWIRTI